MCSYLSYKPLIWKRFSASDSQSEKVWAKEVSEEKERDPK